MAQQFFSSVTLSSTAAIPLNVQVGFTPARIELINLTQVQSPTNTNGWKAIWQTGMVSGSAILTTFKTATNINDVTTYTGTNGITLLNSLGSEVGQYGAIVSGFTNANPGVITVDSTSAAQITAGCFIKVALLADNQAGPTLNGIYYVQSVTATTITVGTAPAGTSLPSYPPYTVNSLNTTSSGVYVSGGVVTLLQTNKATTPNPPNNIFSNQPSWWNEAIQGFTIGTSCFANAGSTDTILIAAYDLMSP